MKPSLVVSMVALMVTNISAQEKSSRSLEVVPSVDLPRYAGTWYEIARLPNRFQEQCAGDVTATYAIRADGEITVVNRCRQASGAMSEAEGRARRAAGDGPNTKLEVRFAPAFLSFLPFVWGDYWIIDLAPDYSYAVIGEPKRRYLWVLARSPGMDEVLLSDILRKVRNQGYDIALLQRTGHSK